MTIIRYLPLFVVFSGACGGERGADDGSLPTPVLGSNAPTPQEYGAGETLFNANCGQCHGQRGRGTQLGPALVHRIYEPSHHADAAFYRAAANGVRAHHWRFGNMPPVTTAGQEDVTQIISYVRWLQREAGIF